MTRSVRLLRLGRTSARNELATVAAVMRAVADARDGRRPWSALVMAELSGPVEALGRWQAGGSVGGALAESFVRRWTGGHGTMYGDGILSLCVVLPDPDAWLEEASPLAGERLLNRYARGLVRGFSHLGLQAAYPGRDFVTIARKNGAYLSAERDARGVVLVQGIVAVETEHVLEDAVPGAGLPHPPPPTALAEEIDDADFERVQKALAEGFAGQFRLDLEGWDAADAARSLAIDEKGLLPLVSAEADPAASLARGAEVEIPIGTLEAFAALDVRGKLARVGFAADWIAASASVAALEAALAGVAPERAALQKAVAPVLADPAHFFIGITSPDPVVEAVLSAAAAATKSG
jgi:hypothetical protein